SSVLLSFRSGSLSPQVIVLIKSHLSSCEFCRAELSLLAHYTRPRKAECQTPDLPINLRILAESILSDERHTHRDS
ncbi:MAG TPA: hypothetical protein VIV15_02230, partial [Anaerolineales bacterium]